jgi:hypothetical protein
MMTIESIIRWLGGLLAISVLVTLLHGAWLGTRREAGRTVGLKGIWLRSPVFYFAARMFFFGLAWLGWIPLPVELSSLLGNGAYKCSNHDESMPFSG